MCLENCLMTMKSLLKYLSMWLVCFFCRWSMYTVYYCDFKRAFLYGTHLLTSSSSTSYVKITRPYGLKTKKHCLVLSCVDNFRFLSVWLRNSSFRMILSPFPTSFFALYFMIFFGLKTKWLESFTVWFSLLWIHDSVTKSGNFVVRNYM